MATAEECYTRLVRAGIGLEEADGRILSLTLWEVFGWCGKWRLYAHGPTRKAAWQNACRQAEALGLLPRE